MGWHWRAERLASSPRQRTAQAGRQCQRGVRRSMTLDDATRRVLEHRSVRNKIALARHCELAPVGDLEIVSRLVREGYLVWLDEAVLPMVAVAKGKQPIVGLSADIY